MIKSVITSKLERINETRMYDCETNVEEKNLSTYDNKGKGNTSRKYDK